MTEKATLEEVVQKLKMLTEEYRSTLPNQLKNMPDVVDLLLECLEREELIEKIREYYVTLADNIELHRSLRSHSLSSIDKSTDHFMWGVGTLYSTVIKDIIPDLRDYLFKPSKGILDLGYFTRKKPEPKPTVSTQYISHPEPGLLVDFPVYKEIRTPEVKRFYQNPQYRYGCFEIQHSRVTQEDALAWETELLINALGPQEIGHRLWTLYRNLNEQVENNHWICGTTASTTIYDGNRNLITATLADSVSFAAVYNDEDKLLGVVRLNSVVHHPCDADETTRLNAGGFVIIHGRLEGALAVSRAIGDVYVKNSGLLSDAKIDITSFDQLAARFNVTTIGKVLLIGACDGFTDGMEKLSQSKEDHEEYLLACLVRMHALESPPNTETEIAQYLVQQSMSNSKDNISVAVQTITSTTPALMLGVYDGHGGSVVSAYVADEVGLQLKALLALPASEYNQQENSVQNNIEAFALDNQTSKKRKNDTVYEHRLGIFSPTNDSQLQKRTTSYENKPSL